VKIIVMGVAGSGKTTIGQALAVSFGAKFIEGDSFHPSANVEKMRNGVALTDSDRSGWLATLAKQLADVQGSVVLTCSALKESYRQILRQGAGDCVCVFLDAPMAAIAPRLQNRTGHYMPPSLLESQFATLEPPQDALRVDATLPVEKIIETILRSLREGSAG
jgi:gluconokinase